MRLYIHIFYKSFQSVHFTHTRAHTHIHAHTPPLGLNSGWHRALLHLSGLAVSTLHKSVTQNKCTGIIESIR